MFQILRNASLVGATILFGCNGPGTLPQTYHSIATHASVPLNGGHDVRIKLAKVGPSQNGLQYRLWPQREHEVEFERFTLTLPTEYRWMRVSPSQGSGVAFVSETSPLHTIALAVFWSKTPYPLLPKGNRPRPDDRQAWARWQAQKFMMQAEVLRLILAGKKQSLSLGQQRLLSFKESPIDAKTCQRYEALGRTQHVPKHLGEVFIFTLFGMACIHPDADFVVVLDYSTRRPAAEKPLPSLRLDAEGVFRSLKFKGTNVTGELVN